MTITEDRLREISEVVYKTKDTAERLEQNWDKDRQDFSEFKNRLGHLEQEVKSLIEVVNKLPERTRDTVAEAAEPIVQEAQNLSDVMLDKKVVAIDKAEAKKQIRSWYKFWRR